MYVNRAGFLCHKNKSFFVDKSPAFIGTIKSSERFC